MVGRGVSTGGRHALIRTCGLIAAIISGTALTGWFIDSRVLSGIRPRYIPMAPNTALSFLALGLSLAMISLPGRTPRRIVRGLALLVFGVAGMRVLEYATGLSLGVDQWAFQFPADLLGLAPVGRMALFTAVNFIICSAAMYLLASPRLGMVNTYGGSLAGVVALVGLSFVLGYVYGKPLIYGTSAIPMALNTAICFMLIGGGLVVMAASRDMTLRRAALKQLRESEERTRRIIETANDAFVETDSDGVITRWNRQAERIFGWSRAEVLGRNIRETLLASDDRQAVADSMHQVVESGQASALSRRVELTALLRDGHSFPVELTMWPLRLSDGWTFNFFIRDITERRRAEEEIRRQNKIIDDDLEFARKFQQALLPQEYPQVPDPAEPAAISLDFHHLYRPAQSLGGDFFHIVKITDYKAGVFIADVMGHGARSALVTAILRTVLEGLARQVEDPAQLLTALNEQYMDIVHRDTEFVFATACYMVLDTQRGEAIIAAAGHPAPVFAQREKRRVTELISLDEVGVALGIMRSVTYNNVVRPLEPGDMVLLYTDGLYEADNFDLQQFGMERVAQAVERALYEQSPLLPALLEDLAAFTGGKPAADDLCMVHVEVREPRASAETSVPASATEVQQTS